MSRSRSLTIAVALTALSLASVLAACAPTSPPAGESASATPGPPASADPTPVVTASATPVLKGFDTIDGTWCQAIDPTSCITITLPYMGDAGSEDSSTIVAATVIPETAPCYKSAAMDPGGGGVAIYYCPAGFTVAQGIVTEGDNPSFDRLYFTQNPPEVGTFFRQEDISAARGN